MATVVKSKETLLAELKTFLRAYNRLLDTGDNSLAKDFLLLPFSIGGSLIMDQVALARDYHILSRLTGTEVDNEATNYKLERLPGSYAVAIITFWTETLPTADVVIQAGTQAKTAGTAFTSAVTFSTVSQATFSTAGFGSYYSFDRIRYEFPVLALCDTIGKTGNVGAELINTLVGTVPQISGVTNLTAAYQGSDSESDDDLKVRIMLAKLGRDLNVTNGVRGQMRGFGFIDAYPVRVEDSDAEKATGIDVFVIDSAPETVSETFSYDPAQTIYYLVNRPVTEVTSVVLGNGAVVSPPQYSAHIDSTSPMRRSVYGQDYIELSTSLGLVPGDSFTVTYNYSKVIKNAQSTVDLVDNRVLTADTLIKRAYPLYLYVTATLTYKANADVAATKSKCRNALAQLLSTYRLSDPIQKSDIIVVLQTGYGDYPVDTVDAVRISSYFLVDEFGNTYLPTDEVISVGKKYYVLYGSATLV